MRKFLLITILCFSITGFSQGIKLKKGKIYLDDTHIASYDGKGGLIRLFTITVSGTDDKPLATMQEQVRAFDIPWEKERRWMQVEFPAFPGKKLGLRFEPSQRMEKDLVEMLFNDSLPRLIKNNTIDEATLDQWIVQKNYDFIADSLNARKIQGEVINAMKENLARDKTLPLQIIKTSESSLGPNSLTTYFEIRQGDVKLGRIIKSKNSGSFGASLKYEWWKILAQPYQAGNGKEALTAAMVANFISGKGTYLVPEGKIVDAGIKNQDAAEYQLTDWLIKSGYL